MTLVQIRKIEKTVKEKELFHIDQATIYKGDRIGLVGTNGSGKTSLLEVIAQVTQADSGVVKHYGQVALLPQLKRTNTTKSGGEITAEYVIQAINKNPAVLLADEPTTHLDTKHIEWIEKEFQAFEGAYIVVSHDRAFLDQVCDTIWELKEGKLTIYSGNYTQYEREKEKELSHQQTEYEKYKRKEQQLLEAQRKKEEQAQSVEGESKHFHYRKKAKKMNKTAKTIEKRLDQLEEVEKPEEQTAVKMELTDMKVLRHRFIIRGNKLEGIVEGKKLWEPADFTIRGGGKVAILGDNGSGKTTLIRKILQSNPSITKSPALKIGYFAQDLSLLEKEKSILENVKEGSPQSETLIRIVLAQLNFKEQAVYKPVSVLSGGERVKVALAKVLVGDYNTLILDEPTNFLDIQAVSALESLLRAYEGSLLLVSHDRRFVSEIATKVLSLEQKQLTQFDGTIEEWQQSKQRPSLNTREEELLRVENELNTVLGKLSIEPTKELDQAFQELVEKKKALQKEIEEE